ncbi:ASCH domain-containing protein [Paenibacillus lutimineralis]|uniref:ASCH domain-containing protein n=1 Tax=Paenibacillus lutimineralis TaxID=2707005 RepID=A0A3Q9I8V0_9BACL|nr:ASCH domain-containing protein [Paenibacillus lutimineralis]AZS15343.1 ASCH domain-containing protein [Paenibacillus lutimineralis]
MKAITIHQPWATLIALREKKFETRSWPTKHRGAIAIHAGKKIDKAACEVPDIKAALARHGYTADNLPTGAVVAKAELLDSHTIFNTADNGIHVIHSTDARVEWIYNNEKAFGWYDEGRYAWELDNVRMLPEPIPAKGQQGLWNWDGGIHEALV